MEYTGTTHVEHPTTGAEITVAVTFKVHPAEPEIGIFGPQYEVTHTSDDLEPLTTDEGAVDAHVDDLPDSWFAQVVTDYHEGLADYRLEQVREGRA